MKTPKIFENNLKKGIITEEMLELVLFSLNKRAKNCSEKKQEYYYKAKSCRNGDLYYKNVEKYKDKEKEYYSDKEFLIKTLLQPICIHKETKKETCRIRYNDIYDEEYDIYEHSDKVVHSGCYYDKQLKELINFIDVIEINEINLFYLFYETKSYSFHIPIDEENIFSRGVLPIIDIDRIISKGREIDDLLSVQFCKKVVDFILETDCDDYSYIRAEEGLEGNKKVS